MSFTIKRLTLFHPALNQALGKIYNHQFTDARESYNALRLVAKVEIEQKSAHEERTSLLAKYRDHEDGKAVGFKSELEAEARKVAEDWGKEPITIERYKIKADSLAGCQLAPAELEAVEEMIDGLEPQVIHDVTNITTLHPSAPSP